MDTNQETIVGEFRPTSDGYFILNGHVPDDTTDDELITALADLATHPDRTIVHLPTGGFIAAMCPQCDTVGGHIPSCPDSDTTMATGVVVAWREQCQCGAPFCPYPECSGIR